MSKVEVPADVQAALKRLYHEMPTPVRVSVISTGAGGHVATWMLGTPGECVRVWRQYAKSYSEAQEGGRRSCPALTRACYVMAGASSVLVDFSSPYCTGAVKELLGGGKPASGYCSSETALALAQVRAGGREYPPAVHALHTLTTTVSSGRVPPRRASVVA